MVCICLNRIDDDGGRTRLHTSDSMEGILRWSETQKNTQLTDTIRYMNEWEAKRDEPYPTTIKLAPDPEVIISDDESRAITKKGDQSTNLH